MKQIFAPIIRRSPLILSVLLLLFLTVSIELYIPYAVAMLIDRSVRLSSDRILFLLLLTVLALLTGTFAGKLTARITASFAADLRSILYRRLQELSVRQRSRFSNASLLGRLTTDVANLTNGVQVMLTTFSRSILFMLGTVGIVLSVKPQLGLVLSGALTVSAAAAVFITKKALPFFVKGLSMYDRTNQTVQENIAAAHIVKAFAKGPDETEKFQEQSERMRDFFIQAEKITALSDPVMVFVMDAGLMFTVWTGSRSFLSASLSAGTFILLFTCTANLLAAMLAMFGALYTAVMTLPSVQRAAEVLQDTAGRPSPSEASRTIPSSSVSFQHVSFYNEGQPVLKNIHVSIPAGSLVGITGPAGSGKSTFVKMILGLYLPDEGMIQIGGMDICRLNLRAVRENIGFVQQKDTLFSGTIRENLLWGNPDATEEMLDWAVNTAYAGDFIEQRGYDAPLAQMGANLSGGQRQRLCIARAVLRKPSILILDDAASAVDTLLAQKIFAAIREALPDTTMIMTTQKIRQVMACDRILVFEHGEICGQGTHEDLLAHNRIYQEIAASQQIGGDFDAE